MADVPYDLNKTLGALLVGGVITTALSGMVTMQTYLYFRTYQKDALITKLTVLSVWFLDAFHSATVCMANWSYLIASFGNNQIHDTIFWSLGVSIASTAILTFIVHCFFVHRLYRLSKCNFFITVPIAILALFRLASACVTTSEMILLGKFSAFAAQFRWVFTLGLCLSAIVDMMITSSLCFYLKRSQSGFSDMDEVIDAVILYTIENGILTCVATLASLICWLVMPHNLIYMALHFAISKLYANSLLASLNARRSLRQSHPATADVSHRSLGPGTTPSHRPRSKRFSKCELERAVSSVTTKLEINVEKTVDFVVDDDSPYTPSCHGHDNLYPSIKV